MITTLSKTNYGELVLPCTYTSIESEEMMYVEGGLIAYEINRLDGKTNVYCFG